MQIVVTCGQDTEKKIESCLLSGFGSVAGVSYASALALEDFCEEQATAHVSLAQPLSSLSVNPLSRGMQIPFSLLFG